MFQILLLFIGLISDAKAAPCCAGSSAIPSMITGDEAGMVSLAFSVADVVGDAAGAGKGLPVFRDEKSGKELRQNLSLNVASLISDRWQVGASIPLIQNSLSSSSMNETNIQMGDVSATLGFEAVPEWEYSEWRPRVYTFTQWVMPTGRSMNDSKTMLASDVSGLGVHQLHLGVAAIKRWNDWDLIAVTKIGKELSRGSSFLNASLGGGYSFGDVWRTGMNLETQYQSPMKIADSYTSQKLVWNTGVTLTYLVGAQGSAILGYTDQTLFGPAINTTLARSFSFSYQQRFER